MLICVTNRQLCQEDFLCRINRLAQSRPYAIMLREKDLDPPAYERLARKVKAVCDHYGVLLILHQNITVAEGMKATYLHLAMPDLRICQAVGNALVVGASVHSVAEAVEAQALGAAYLIAGHIYATDCKRGTPPRGVVFLQDVCRAVAIPVFAIGGVKRDNVSEILASGARGCCIMSEAMTCQDPETIISEYNTKSSYKVEME